MTDKCISNERFKKDPVDGISRMLPTQLISESENAREVKVQICIPGCLLEDNNLAMFSQSKQKYHKCFGAELFKSLITASLTSSHICPSLNCGQPSLSIHEAI